MTERTEALTYYGIAEYQNVIDHCVAMRRAGITVPSDVIHRLHDEQRHLITRAAFMLQLPLAATLGSDRRMVQRARDWLTEHPTEIERIEREEVRTI
jgi:hypothetical protein